MDRSDTAKTVLEEAINWHPGKPLLYTFLAEIIYFYDKNCEKTIDICNKAIGHGVADERIFSYRALALADLGQTNRALQLLDRYLDNHFEAHLAEMAHSQVSRQHQDYQKSLEMVNKWLTAGGLEPIQSSGSRCELNVEYLSCTPGYTVDTGELVSVIMTTYGRDERLPFAIASILNQTYQNLELIIVDDCSTDDTFAYLQRITQFEKRVHLLRSEYNAGTYVSKNNGLAISNGKYFAFMDSDDWLHPQTIEKQIETLQTPETLAVMCGFFRVDEKSNIEFKPEGPTGQAHVTLCFQRDPVLSTLGYFDAVRTGADSEHLERLIRVFGPQALERIKLPLLVSTRHSESITGGSNSLGFSWYGPGAQDSLYAASFRRWHCKIIHEKHSPFMPHPLRERKFDAPDVMLP